MFFKKLTHMEITHDSAGFLLFLTAVITIMHGSGTE